MLYIISYMFPFRRAFIRDLLQQIYTSQPTNILAPCGRVQGVAKCTQGVPGGKVNILGGYSIGHSKQKTLYEHVSYSERFPR